MGGPAAPWAAARRRQRHRQRLCHVHWGHRRHCRFLALGRKRHRACAAALPESQHDDDNASQQHNRRHSRKKSQSIASIITSTNTYRFTRAFMLRRPDRAAPHNSAPSCVKNTRRTGLAGIVQPGNQTIGPIAQFRRCQDAIGSQPRAGRKRARKPSGLSSCATSWPSASKSCTNTFSVPVYTGVAPIQSR